MLAMKGKFGMAGILAATLALAPVVEAVELVSDGQARSVVVLADKPSPAARAAGKLLVEQIRRVSGAEIRQVGESKLDAASGLARILVGQSGMTRQLGALPDGLGPGGILIRTYPKALVLLGTDESTPADPNGSHYAVTTFLEQELGIRYLWPGELGLVIPKRKTISVNGLDFRHTPLIAQRRMRNSRYGERIQRGLDYLAIGKEEYDRIQSGAFGKASSTPSWFQWQRLGGSIGLRAGHAYGYTWEKYHEQHPEWFALQPNGSRDLTKLNPDRSRLCKSNEALIDALARDKIQELEKTGRDSVSLSPNDGGQATYCMCDKCKRLDPPEGRAITLMDNSSGSRSYFPYVSLTDRMVWFWNGLAERITAEYPDAWLTVYAYSVYKAPPLREKLHPNLAVGFVGMNYRKEAERAQARQDWMDWAKMTEKLYWRPNLLLFARREGTPAVFVHKLAEDLHYFAHHSLVGTDFDSVMHHWATEGLNYYVLSRLLWDPDEDVDEILDDYCRAGFGDAWREVRRYFTRIEELTDLIAEGELHPTEPYTGERVAELGSILDAATGKAGGNEVVKKRLAFLRAGLEFAALQHQTHRWNARHQEKPLSKAEVAELKRILAVKWELMRRMTRENPLAVNIPAVAWGSEGVFRRFGWRGAKSITLKTAMATAKIT